MLCSIFELACMQVYVFTYMKTYCLIKISVCLINRSTHKSRSQFSHFGSAARRSSSESSGIPTPISLR